MKTLRRTAWLGALVVLTSCGGAETADSSSAARKVCTEETRAQDDRDFTVATTYLPFAALDGATVETDRWWGVLGGAGYRIEVPKNWNGKLVMYAHGYAGTGSYLVASNPRIRRHLIQNGYAWAASTYSANYYDARAGLEDTNALALAFSDIAKANGRELGRPGTIYITGHSMGGHIAAAAVEKETKDTVKNKVHYKGAVPMCGNVGDTELFDYYLAYQYAASLLAQPYGLPGTQDTFFQACTATGSLPFWPTSDTDVRDDLVVALREVVKNLTGGQRPVFYSGFQVCSNQAGAWASFTGDGTIGGILNKSILDTSDLVYKLDASPSTAAYLNAYVPRISAEQDANRQRCDGLRWIPKVNGFFRVPVVSIHTLGDLFVPFAMEQVYRQRAVANQSGEFLVQRAIRGGAHCDFTIAEEVAAFEAMAAWAETGVKPAGDDVLTAATVAGSNYGCAFTNGTPSADDSADVLKLRAVLQYYEPCAAQ